MTTAAAPELHGSRHYLHAASTSCGCYGTARTSKDDRKCQNSSLIEDGLPHSYGFLKGDINEPDTVSLLLLRSGDVEQNPGPLSPTKNRPPSQATPTQKSKDQQMYKDQNEQAKAAVHLEEASALAIPESSTWKTRLRARSTTASETTSTRNIPTQDNVTKRTTTSVVENEKHQTPQPAVSKVNAARACVEPMIRKLRPRTNKQKDDNNNQINPLKLTEPLIAVSQTEAAIDPEISGNPAPTKTRSESNKQIPTKKRIPPQNSTVNSQADANAVGGGERTPNADTNSHTEINKCFKCKRTFTSKPIECTQYLSKWHKQEKCSRDKEKLIAEMMSQNGWQCKNCRDAADPQLREQSNPNTEETTTEEEQNEAPIPEVNNPT